MKLGIAPDSLIRAQAGVRHILQEIAEEGHFAAQWDTLLKEASKLLEISDTILEEAIKAEIAEENLVSEEIGGKPSLFLTTLHRAESGTATGILRLLKGAPPWGRDRRRQGDPLGGGENRPDLIGIPAGGRQAGPRKQGCRHHRRPGSGKDHPRERACQPDCIYDFSVF